MALHGEPLLRGCWKAAQLKRRNMEVLSSCVGIGWSAVVAGQTAVAAWTTTVVVFALR